MAGKAVRAIRRLGLVLAVAVALVGVSAGTAVANPNAPFLGPGYVTTGEGVGCVQRAYNYVSGRGLRVDNDYGQATYNATRDFQAIFGLARDGIVGRDTGEAIMFAVNWKAGFDLWHLNGCWRLVPSHT